MRRQHRRRAVLLLSTALAALALPARAQIAATARPQGGQVVAGSASIAQSASVTAITQTSQNAAIDWQSFNVGSAETVAVQQPNAQSMLLNRVVGPDPSVIAGRITANGGVAIVNQSGVVFDRGAEVDVQTLMVSTANISNANFMSGTLAFDQPGKPNAAVVNHGTITVKQAGLVALVAPSVRNTGLIQATLGRVVLAGAAAFKLDLYGDGLMSIDVTKQVTRLPLGPGGRPVAALVTNTGTIIAEGGHVLLTASAADGIVQTLLSAGGTISVNGGRGAGGTITLAGVGGSMVIEGSLTATGATGGTVQAVTDGAVSAAASARIDASGRSGGGSITLGGGQAASVGVAKGAVLRADATVSGNGGHVALIGRSSTTLAGTVSARGGARGGNGGTVEVSAASVAITGGIDTGAPAGSIGSILLDPDNLSIVHASAGSGAQDTTVTSNGGTLAAGDASVGADTISDAVLNSFTGNVRLQANTSITVANGVSVNLNAGSSPQSLVLEAGGTITVAAGATLSATGTVVLATGNAVSFTPPSATANPLVQINGTIASSGGNVMINAGLGGSVAIGGSGATDALVFAAGSVGITAPAGYSQTGGTVFGQAVSIAAPNRLLDGGAILSPGTGSAPGIDLAGGGTTVTNGGVISAGGASALVSLGTLTLASGTVASGGRLQADAVVQQGGTIAAIGGAAFGSLRQSAGALLAVGGDLGIGSGSGGAGQLGSQVIAGAADLAGSVNVGGTLSIWSAGGIGLAGTVLARRVLATAAGGIMQSAGTLEGLLGVALLTADGAAVQGSGAVLAGGGTYGVAVRAPLGEVAFGNITLPKGLLTVPLAVSLGAPSLVCGVCTGQAGAAASVTVPAPVLTPQGVWAAIPDVTLAGATIVQGASQVLTASTLSLYATQSVDLQGSVVASELTGTAGLAQPGQGLSATDAAAWVHLDGAANAIAALGDFTSTGVLRLTDAQSLLIPDSTVQAPLIRLLATGAIDLEGGIFITGGEGGLPVRGQVATDPSSASYADDSQRGLFLAFTGSAGQVRQTGLTEILPIGSLPALLRIDLPAGSANTVSLDPTNGLYGPDAAVFLHLGTGTASGHINLGQLAVIYDAVPSEPTRLTGTLRTASGTTISGQLAAALASVGTSTGQFVPSGAFQINGCALTSSSCVLLGNDSVPVQSPIRPISFGAAADPRDDADVLVPNISDQDY